MSVATRKASGAGGGIGLDRLLHMYKQMVAIRLFEERVNDLYTRALGRGWRQVRMLLLIKNDLTFVWGINAGKNLAQGAFAGPVFAHQRVATAALDLKAHTIQRQHAGETFRY